MVQRADKDSKNTQSGDRSASAHDAELTDVSERAAEAVGKAAGDLDEAEEIVVVSERLREKGEARKQRKRAEEEASRTVEVSEEREAAPIVKRASERNRARILLLTRDASLLTGSATAGKHIHELSGMFAEVHVIVLTTDKKFRGAETKRVGDDAWVYAAYARPWWRTIGAARRVAKRQLMFGGGGFRPDIIIADDPFEAGVAGHMLARRYERPFQVHVQEDFFDPMFKNAAPHNAWRQRFAHYVLKRTTCIRTHSDYMRKRVLERYKLSEKFVEVLPIFYDLNSWRSSTPQVDLKKKHPEFTFLLLHFSTMDEHTNTKDIIDGLYHLLRQYTGIGFIIVGSGKEQKRLKGLIAEYGLERQVLFEKKVDALAYITTADVVIHVSDGSLGNDILLKAAAVDTPLICLNQGLASELFIDEESILLCPPKSPACFGEKVNLLLNENPLRKKLAMNARNVVFKSVEQDYPLYLRAYRESIERCLLVEEGNPA